MEDEEERQLKQTIDKEEDRKSSVVIRIPSYEEVFQNSQPTPLPSLFRPSTAFSEAFSFIKNTEFYTAPPQPSEPSLRPENATSSQQAEASSSSSSATAVAGGIHTSVPSSSSSPYIFLDGFCTERKPLIETYS